MDRGDIAHITLWFLSNYSLLDFIDEKRFIEIYKKEIGHSRKQLQYANEIRRELLKVSSAITRPKVKLEAPQVKEEKPKEKEHIEIKEKPTISLEEKSSIQIEEKSKENIVLEEKPTVEEKPIMKEKIQQIKPSLGQRIRAFIKRIFRI
jgi:hypothetical protein